MHPPQIPPSSLPSPSLGESLDLAQATARRLAVADTMASSTYRAALLTSGAGVRQLKESKKAIAQKLLEDLKVPLDQTWARLSALDACLSPKERVIAIASWRSFVQPYFLRVPLLKILVDRPSGYPGDYQLNRIIEEDPAEAPDPLGEALIRYVAEIGPCKAHRHRKEWLNAQLRARAGRRPLKALFYGCRYEYPLMDWLEKLPSAEIVLYDTDEKALRLCGEEFAARGLKVQRRMLQEATDGPIQREEMDVVVAMGSFDHLPTEALPTLSARLVGALSPGGRLFCSGVLRENPWRGLMEYMGGWYVSHRTHDQLITSVVSGRSDLTAVEAERDPSGANLFLSVQKKMRL